MFILRASPPAAGPLLLACMLAGLLARRLGAWGSTAGGWRQRGVFELYLPLGIRCMLQRGGFSSYSATWTLDNATQGPCSAIWGPYMAYMQYMQQILHMAGGSQAEETCPGGGKCKRPGPTNQLTDSPEASPEPPRTWRRHEHRTHGTTGSHIVPRSLVAPKGAGRF